MNLGEIDDAAEQMKIAVQVLKDFKNLFFEYTEKLPTYFKDDKKPVLWEFRPGLIFRYRLKILYFRINKNIQSLRQVCEARKPDCRVFPVECRNDEFRKNRNRRNTRSFSFFTGLQVFPIQ